MSVVELRRNSSPHLGALAPTAQPTATGVWRKSSHPPLSSEHSSSSSITSIDLSPISSSVPTTSSGPLLDSRSSLSRSSFASMPPHNRPIHGSFSDASPRDNADASAQHDRPVTPGVYDRMLIHSDDMKSLIQSIADEAKRIIHSETCSVFILDRETNDLVAKVFERADDLEQIRVPLGCGVVGKVASNKTIMNIRDVKKCPFFYANVDELTGFQTRNILCFPIIDNADSNGL
ncbi:hypothetical protein WR25_11654 [Diploscapter pachys]|uniref:GAF domain-containing protein n=1 Tax=Diploscapter pachys TaxID=2018661 RepID=A0A2A2KTS0_9BILA|nr:hypothetical protein WR25_11654 [Diploscapter pachys]